MRGRVWFPALILVFFSALLINGSLELSVAAMIFPWVVGALGITLVAWEIVRGIRVKREASPKVASFRFVPYLLKTAWFLAILPMIYLLGFLVAIPLYTFLSLKFSGEKWLLSSITTLLIGAFLYFGIAVTLKVPLYEGLLFLSIMG